jgi:hypothetical protein
LAFSPAQPIRHSQRRAFGLEQKVSVYKLYCYDGAGNIWVADWIEAASDEEAVAAARLMKAAVKCEVWQQDRLVATLDSGIATLSPPAQRDQARA